jgi:hypothetical protein
MTTITNKLVIYFPSTTKDGVVLDGRQWRATALEMARRWGGVTVTEAEGIWFDGRGLPVYEKVRLLTSWVFPAALEGFPNNEPHYNAIADFVEGLLVDLNQETFAYEYGGVFHLINHDDILERREA